MSALRFRVFRGDGVPLAEYGAFVVVLLGCGKVSRASTSEVDVEGCATYLLDAGLPGDVVVVALNLGGRCLNACMPSNGTRA